MSLVCTCAQGKSRSTAVQLFDAIARGDEDYFDTLSKNNNEYILPNIALLCRLLEHYASDGNRIPGWLKNKPLDDASLLTAVFKQTMRT